MGQHTGLGGLLGVHRAVENTCEVVARSLKMNVDGAACRDAGTGRSSTVGPVGDSQCMERLESLISRTGVWFSPAVTRGILRPFPR